MTINEILLYDFLGNNTKEYLIALLFFILTIAVLKIFKNVVIKKLKKLADHTKTEIDNLIITIIEKIGWLFYVLLALLLCFQFIQVTAVLKKALVYIVVIIATYYVIKAVQEFIDYATQKVMVKRQKENNQFDATPIKTLSIILKVGLWVVAVILISSNLGYNVSTLIAGLGIGGIAIALALQNVLTDIFASFSIYFDKPFQVGDFIIVGDDLGVVKKIGIKTTRLQTLQGEELVISNKELTETRIHNYKKMQKRRIVFSFGVTYDTSSSKLKKIPQILEEIMGNIELAELDRVHFNKFGDFSLNFEAVYYLKSSDYNEYMNTQQEINLGIKKRFETEGIEFAYPTQTIFVNK